jgi:spore germination protein GerM
MISRPTLIRGAIVVFAGIAAWILFIGLPRWYTAPNAPAATASGTAGTTAPSAIRKITATLYYVAEDGMALAAVQREVPFGGTVAEQARAIIEAQIAAAAAPLVSAIPADTKLRDVYVTERGDAFVDLSGELIAKHPGGSLLEIFTVYTLVNALTVNLPAVTRVQILVDGKEVDTLAGHVDLRHPLSKNMEWVVHDTQ